jgi:hypothetical protein
MLTSLSAKTRTWLVAAVAVMFAVLLLAAGQAPAHAAGLNGTFAIKNKTTGRCADVPGFGKGYPNAPVNQYTCRFATSDNQRWTFVPNGTATGASGTKYNQYLIKNAKDGLCLDAPGFGTNANGARIIEYTCAGDPSKDNQQWYTVVRTANGRTGVWIVNTKSKKCLDVSGTNAGNDARLTLFTCSDAKTEDHYWAITANP